MKKIFFLVLSPVLIFGQSNFNLAILKYNGGGDWYANPTSVPNLIEFCNNNLQTNINTDVKIVEAGSLDIFNFPFIYMTGHGNVVFSDSEVENLNKYLISGGFLHIDDNYGMDTYIRPEISKIFPQVELIELPSNHGIFNQTFFFENGIPKIHEHNKQRAQALGIIIDGRLVLLYTYETDLGDGWEDKEIHNNSEEIRRKSLEMGANIIEYVFTN